MEERGQIFRFIVAHVFTMTQMIVNLHMEFYSFETRSNVLEDIEVDHHYKLDNG